LTSLHLTIYKLFKKVHVLLTWWKFWK
jgi:hypothetical protein